MDTLFGALSTRMNLYTFAGKLQQRNWGSWRAKNHRQITFFKIAVNVKSVRDEDVDMITEQKDPLCKIRQVRHVLDLPKHAE